MNKSKLLKLYILYIVSFILLIVIILIDADRHATIYKFIFNFTVILFIFAWYFTMKTVRKENKKIKDKLMNPPKE